MACTMDLMSSEESQWDEDNDGCTTKYYKKPIPWRADKVLSSFQRYDCAKECWITFRQAQGPLSQWIFE